MKSLFLVSVALFIFSTIATAQTIILNTQIMPPYQVQTEDKLTGISVKTLQCIFKKMNQEYTIAINSWIRARKSVEKGKTHGMFTAMPNARTDKYATLSAPIAMEKWFYYYKNKAAFQDSDFKKHIKIGVIRASNQSEWLSLNGFTRLHEVNTYEQLFQLLNSNRIDTFIADHKTFEEEISKQHSSSNKLLSKFCKYTPLGVYFSNTFLKNNSEFLEKFNEHVYSCKPETLKLSDLENDTIRSIAMNKVMNWVSQPEVISMIQTQNSKHRSLTNSEIIGLDKQWRKEVKSKNRPLIDKLLNNSLSAYLKKVQSESDGLYTEIFVMDNKGLNVGQSDQTSDYWQGDEAKFKNSFSKGSKALFIDKMEYDESSRQFQSQLSLTIDDPASGTPIGAITVGINLEKALNK